MPILSIELPIQLSRRVEALARDAGISAEQFIASAVVEKLARSGASSIVSRRERGSRKKFDAALAQVPDNPPDEADRF